MRLAARLSLTCLLVVMPVAALASDGPSPSPGAPGDPEPVLWLRGPFGTVPSVSPDAGRAGTQSSGEGRPLDGWVRSAPLRLETGDADVSIGEWRASFVEVHGTSKDLESTGTGHGGTPASGVSLVAPDTAGTYRLEATATLSTGATASGTWTILVPDRELPADGVIDVPAPRLLLSATHGTVDGWSGSGCYIYLCVDVGRLPPLRMIPSLDVAEGEDLTLRLSDGSGIAAWKVTLYPIVSGVQPPVDEMGAEPDVPVDSVTITAPVESEWLMQVEVTYDRLRGWAHAFYRLASIG